MPDNDEDPLGLNEFIVPPRRPPKNDFRSLYQQVGEKYNVDPDLLYRQAKQESSLNPRARGPMTRHGQAAGMAQFIPSTAKQYGLRVDNQVDDRLDPEKAADAQARLMRDLLDKYNGDEKLALAAYNSGTNRSPESARRAMERIPETRNYVAKITQGRNDDPLGLNEFLEQAPDPLGLNEFTEQQPPQQTPPRKLTDPIPEGPVVGKAPGGAAGRAHYAARAHLDAGGGRGAGELRRIEAAEIRRDRDTGVGRLRELDDPEVARLKRITADVASQGLREAPRLLEAKPTAEQEVLRRVREETGAPVVPGLAPQVIGPRSMQARERGLLERAGEAIAPYVPGLTSIDTPAGIKTDVLRAPVTAASLGAVNLQREITPEERLLNPRAETDRDVAEFAGSVVGGIVPYVAAGKAIGSIAALNKAGRVPATIRNAATFGTVDAVRQEIRAHQTGQPVDLSELGVSTAIGAAMGAIPGVNAGMVQRVIAAVAPQAVADVAQGTPLDQAIINGFINIGFEMTGTGRIKPPKELSRATETTAAPEQATAPEAQRYRHLNFGEVTTSDNQKGVPRGEVRVVDADGAEHVIIKPSGARNQRAIPIPAEPAADTLPRQAAQPAESTAPTTDRRGPARPSPEDWLSMTPGEQARAKAQVAAEVPVPPDTDALERNLARMETPEARAELRANDRMPDRDWMALTPEQQAQMRTQVDREVLHPPDPSLEANLARMESPEGKAATEARLAAEMQGVEVQSNKPPTVEVPLHPKDTTYTSLLKKATAVGPNLYELTEKQITPALRAKLSFRGRPEETTAFSLRPKGDVTGNPSDRGWILKDKRPDYISRNTRNVEQPTNKPSVEPAAPEPTYGATNKLVTRDRAEAARARLKAKLSPNRPTTGIDVTALADLAEIGAFHIEAGSRSFAAWSKQFLSEFGDDERKAIQPHLQDIYSRAGKLAGDVLPNTTAVKNQSAADLRQSLELTDLPAPEKKSWQQSIDNAVAKGLDKQAEKLADDVLSGKQDALSNDEAAGVLHRTRELENEYEARHAADKSDPELARIEATLDRLTAATKAAGTETARALNFRKATVDQDFKLISMIRKAKEAKGRDLTTKERERYESIAKERDQAIKERDAAVVALSSKRLQVELDRASRQRSRAETREKLDQEAAVIRDNIAAEFARLKSSNVFSAGGLGKLDPDGIITRNLLRYARNRAKAEVGLKAEALIDEAHALVSDFGITRRQVAEAISGYSITPTDRRSEAAKRLADIRSEITQLLQEEDIAAGTRSPRSEGPRLREGRGPREGPRMGPAEGPRPSDVRRVPAQGPKVTDAPLQGPRQSDVRKVRAAGPRLEDAPVQGPKKSDVRQLPVEGPRFEDAPRQGPRLSDARQLPAEGPRLSESTERIAGPKYDLVRNANRLKALQKQEAEWERRFNERDFEPKPKVDYPYNSDVRRAEDRVKIAEAKFRREMERARPGHQFRNLSGVWKAWLLSGPPTQAMNIAGTGTYQVFREVARMPAAIADAAMAPFTGRRSIQGMSPTAMIESVMQGAGGKGLRDFLEIMRHGATAEQMKRHQFEEIDFGIDHPAVKVIELAHNAIFRFMSASDRVFWQGAYRRNLIDRATIQARNEGVSNVRERARELMNDPVIKADAEHDAFVSTFNNDNALSTRIKRARSAVVNPKSLMGKKSAERFNAAENLALDLILPFDRTPTNVIARILEASPLGYGKNAVQLAGAIMRGNMPIEHQRQLAQTFGNATAGTALMALGWYLAAPDKKVVEVDGHDVFLNIPGTPKLNLRFASPVGNILSTGARARVIHEDPKSSNWDYLKTALKEPGNQPLLRATTQLSDISKDPKTNLTKFAGRTASSAIPFSGAGRFVGQQLDPELKREADSSFTQQFKRNVPILRESLPVTKSEVFRNLTRSTPTTKELQRLNIRVMGAQIRPDEPRAEYQARKAWVNTQVAKQVDALIGSESYKKLDDKARKDAIHAISSRVSAHYKNEGPERPMRPARPKRPERKTRAEMRQ